MISDFRRGRSLSITTCSFFVDWGNANIWSSSQVCWAINYVCSTANFAAAIRIPCPCTGKWSRMIVNLSLCSARWILCKKKGIPECILFVTQRITIIGYSSIRSSRRPGSRRRNLLHSSKSSASTRFHFHSTPLKKEMDNELTIVFSSDLEEHSNHKKLKKKIGSFIQQRLGSEIFGSCSKMWRPTFVFCLHWVTDWELLIAVIIFLTFLFNLTFLL